MKNKALDMVHVLQNFLKEIETVNNHPYANGLKIDKVLKDLIDYTKQIEDSINNIEEKQENTEHIGVIEESTNEVK